tara:strand:- start:397 stop:1248 length:852 start_codon:yes stop_codon:yes gene_type:complete
MSFISGGSSFGRQSINRGTPFIVATGGSVDAGEIDGNYKYHIFNSNGNFIVSSPGKDPDNVVEYLVIGAGGNSATYASGGGGAGAYRTATGHVVTAQNYSITVGSGSSIFDTITSAKGAYGANTNGPASILNSATASGAGRYGGAGTGAGGTSGAYGNDGGAQTQHSGGYPSGGGGGAGGAGQDNQGNMQAGAGGAGLASSITGESIIRAGGGGGGGNFYSATSNTGGGAGGSGGGGDGDSNGTGENGAANTGGGAGGGSGTSAGSSGTTGGTGVVILRYKFQ